MDKKLSIHRWEAFHRKCLLILYVQTVQRNMPLTCGTGRTAGREDKFR